MSVIQTIRDKYAAVVIAVIALSLIAFIAMDAFVGRNRGMSSRNGTVAKINGETISRTEFEKKVTLMQAMYGQQAPPREQLTSNVWEQSIDEIVMKQEYDKLGMQISNKELNDLLFGANPPQWLSQQFKDATTGEFKVNEAKEYFKNIKKQKNNPNLEMFEEGYLMPTIYQELRTKYMSLLSNSTYIPKWMAEKSFADQNSIAKISYVSVPYTSITDTTIKASDDDIKAYMMKHKDLFKQEDATRSVSYIYFNASPSGQDSSKVLGKVSGLKNEFGTATDPEVFLAKEVSDLPYLNGYTLGSKMQVPNADSIKQLADGQMFGPYLDGKNYTIAKMIGRRMMPDSAKVRHILIKTAEKGQSTFSDSLAKIRIDSISNAAKGGADFNALVLKYSDDQGSKNTKGEYTFTSTQFSNLSKEFAEVAFYGQTGDKKTVKVENSTYSGYHYIEVLEQKKVEMAYKVAYLAKAIEPSIETINNANNLAQQFAAANRNKTSFDASAAKQTLLVQSAPDLKQSDYNVPGLGENRQFVRWAFEAKKDEVSEPFEIGDKYVVGVLTTITEKGLMSVTKARAQAEQAVINEKKAQKIIETKFKGGSTIEDVAKTAGVSVMIADSVSYAQPFIPNVGNEPKVVGASFNKALQGKVSEPIAGNTGVFVVKGESVSAAANTTMTVDVLRKQMESQQKQMGGYNSVNALKKAAKIDDNRFEFY